MGMVELTRMVDDQEDAIVMKKESRVWRVGLGPAALPHEPHETTFI